MCTGSHTCTGVYHDAYNVCSFMRIQVSRGMSSLLRNLFFRKPWQPTEALIAVDVSGIACGTLQVCILYNAWEYRLKALL